MTPNVEIAIRPYVVYDAKTGTIVLVHHALSVAGAKFSGESERAAAITQAGSFGFDARKHRVLAVDAYDATKPWKVDVKSGQVVAQTPRRAPKKAKAPDRKGRTPAKKAKWRSSR